MVLLLLLGMLLPFQRNVVADEGEHRTRLEDLAAQRFYFYWTPHRSPLISAHRGGPEPGYPENSIEAFENALRHAPCIIECDVAMTADSVLVLMHDRTVDRTTTGSGAIEELTWSELSSYRLVDEAGDTTAYSVPTLSQVLTWTIDRAVLMLDPKPSLDVERMVHLIRAKDAARYTAIISYNADQARRFYELAPEMMLSVNVRSEEDLARLNQRGVPLNRMVAFVGVSEPDTALYRLLHGNGIRTILGTMGNLDRRARHRGPRIFADLYENGADILSTDEVELAAEAIDLLLERRRTVERTLPR